MIAPCLAPFRSRFTPAGVGDLRDPAGQDAPGGPAGELLSENGLAGGISEVNTGELGITVKVRGITVKVWPLSVIPWSLLVRLASYQYLSL